MGEEDGRVMNIGECMCCSEHWVLCETQESLTCTPKTNNIFYVD